MHARKRMRFASAARMFACCFFFRRVAVDAVEAQGVKRRRTQLDVDSAYGSVF